MATAESKQVPVTKRALIQRINRALQKQGEVLRTTRGDRWRYNLGDHYIIDISGNFVLSKHVDLVELGRDLGVLALYERLEA